MIATDNNDDDLLDATTTVDDLFDDDDQDDPIHALVPSPPVHQEERRVRWSSTPSIVTGTPPPPPKLVMISAAPRRPSSVAEARLREVLASLSAQDTRHLSVSLPLFGVVDLGKVLADQKFVHVESVTFVPGGITRIVGVPDDVVHLECSNNDLTAASLQDLGPRLQILVAAHNRIAGDVCVAHLASLRHLNLDHNAVRRFVPEEQVEDGDHTENRNKNESADEKGEIGHDDDDPLLFPSVLETLIVSHNQLQSLDLASCPVLRRLEARHNARQLLVTNAPQTLQGTSLPDGAVVKHAFVAALTTAADATPRTTLPEGVARHSHTFLAKGGAPSSSSSAPPPLPQLLAPMQMPADYERNVERYFSEKAAYEAHALKELRSRNKKRNRATTAAAADNDADEDEDNHSTIPTCPHCERPGGMLFSGRNQKYTARCLSADPSTCPFRAITLNRGCFVSLRAHAARLRRRVIAARESMIKLQYDALLGYLPTDGLAKQFPDQVARYNGLLAQFETFQRRAEECFFSAVRADRRRETRREIDVLVAEVRQLLASDPPHWAEAARLQSKEIRALSEKQGKETYPGRGFVVEYEHPDDKKGVLAFQVLPDVNARADTQFNVGVPL